MKFNSVLTFVLKVRFLNKITWNILIIPLEPLLSTKFILSIQFLISYHKGMLGPQKEIVRFGFSISLVFL